MEVVGYAIIKDNAQTGISVNPIKEFIGHPVRVFEFDDHGGVLVLNRNGTALATFTKEDVQCKFECSVHGDVVCPPKLDDLGKASYMMKCIGRKGGYDSILKNMVIYASLNKGVFNDAFLWQKE